jgi:hypothetical protein
VIDTVHLLLKGTAIIRPVTDDSAGCVDHSVGSQSLANDALQLATSESFTQTSCVRNSPQLQVGLFVRYDCCTRVNLQSYRLVDSSIRSI